jgi:hypothetical protein
VTTSGAGTGSRSGRVFISYRRGETSGQARALHDRLAQRFGADRVYMDVDSIALGADFVQNIEQALNSSSAVLVLIGRDWMGQGGGERPFDDPTDFIRLEVGTALALGVPTIPILVERASMPTSAELPEELRPLARRHALELENSRWEYDVSRLVTAVETLLDPAASVGPVAPEPNDELRAGAGEARDVGLPEPAERRPVMSRLHLTGTRLAVLAVILVAAVAVPVVLTATHPNSNAPLPVFNAGPFTGRDPVSIDFPGAIGGPVDTVDHLKWSWSGGQAVGQGMANSCEPGCASALGISTSATIVLSRPHDGAFTILRETAAGHVTTWSYPGHWPVGATSTTTPSRTTTTTSSRTTPTTSSTAPVKATLPLVTCATTYGVSLPAAAPLPSSMTLDVPGNLANRMAVYSDGRGAMKLIGPEGWQCAAIYGANGSGTVRVFPKGEQAPTGSAFSPQQQQAIVGSETSACVGCSEIQACPLFSTASADYLNDYQMSCPETLPAAETTVQISPGVIGFEDPAGIAGDGNPSGGPYPANGVMTYYSGDENGSWLDTCTLPSGDHALCTVALNAFVSSYGDQ